WTYKDGKPWYFLEEWYPAYGNLVPRDIASRAIYKVCVEMGLGIDGKNQVYLDLTHKDRDFLENRLGGILEIYRKFSGDDPCEKPMKIFPSPHYFMGGIHVDYHHMTVVPGLFAAGECDYMYHGANRLGANSLLSAVYSGTVAGPSINAYLKGLKNSAGEIPQKIYDRERNRQEKIHDNISKMDGKENPYRLHEELGEVMSTNVGVTRTNKRLQKAVNELLELKERYKNINSCDTSHWGNQGTFFVRDLANMLEIALVVAVGALKRNESRGAHYKEDYPERNDQDWLKTTIASYTNNGPVFRYEEVDTSLIEPRQRRYDI
ncbi:MAG TPA: FAD-binding protein, partial [Clostridia bacterium]|nr:FAD-binding protein [Clostridia bacterium]